MVPDEQGIFYVLIVGGGPGAGEFTYDASGNLRSANVGQVTTDPVQGITCQQGFSTFNGHGAVINLLSTSLGAFFQYQDLGTSTQGALILAVASVSGTDPVTSHAYGAGLTGIDPVFGDSLTTIGATISLILPSFTANGIVTANTGSGATSPFVSVAGPEQGHAGHAVLRVYGVSADGTKIQGIIISGTDPPVRATQAMLEVQGHATPPDPIIMAIANAAGDLSFGIRVSGDTNPRFQIDSNGNMHWGPGNAGVDIDLYRGSSTLLQTDNGINVLAQILCGQYLDQTGIATPAAPAAGHARLFSDVNGLLRMLTGLAGDTNVYALARRFFTASAAAPGQLINSISAVPVTGITGITVAAAAYHIRGMIIVKQGGVGPGNQAIQIAGPAISSMNIAFESVEGATIFNSGVATALNTNLPTGAIPLNTTGEFHFDGIIRFSASGATFGLAAICITAGADNWTLGTDSYLELSPL